MTEQQPPEPSAPTTGQPPYGYQLPINMYAILALVLGVAVFPPLGIYFRLQGQGTDRPDRRARGTANGRRWRRA